MSESSDPVGERLRVTAAAGRDAPWEATAGSVAAGASRPAGGPVAPRRRLAMAATARVSALGEAWRRTVHGSGPTVRRVAVLCFVAVLLLGAAVGVLVTRNPAGGQHADKSGPTTIEVPTTVGEGTTPTGSTTPAASSTTTTTTTTVAGQTTAPAGATTVPSSTVSTAGSGGLSGYQQVSVSATATCTPNGSTTTCSLGPGPTTSATAECPTGDHVLGGGGSTSLSPGSSSPPATEVSFLAQSDPTPAGSGWSVTGNSVLQGIDVPVTITVTAYAICAAVG